MTCSSCAAELAHVHIDVARDIEAERLDQDLADLDTNNSCTDMEDFE